MRKAVGALITALVWLAIFGIACLIFPPLFPFAAVVVITLGVLDLLQCRWK